MGTRRFNVELWVNTVITVPEEKISKLVSSADSKDVVQQARNLVASENPEINHRQIDTWLVEELPD
jgi:hypothetical protein